MDRQEDDEVLQIPLWKSYLYHLQQQAPKPKRIVCQREIPNRPPYYGRGYHGAISRENADFLLTIGGEGSYLIRESLRAPGQFTLAIRFEGVTKNFKLYYDGQHYVGEKRFDTVQDLVADGLITFYLESKAADYIAALSSQSNYAESPYVAYNTHKKCCLVPRSRSGGSTAVTRSRNASSGSGGSLGNRASLPVEGRVSKFSDSRHNVTIVSAPATIITPSLSQTVLEQPPEGSTVIPDGCVSHATNTDGPRRKSSATSVPVLPPGDSAVKAPTPQLPPRVLDYKKPHTFKMLEEPDLFPPCQPVDSSTSSPPLNMHVVVSAALEHDKAVPHNFKASSVSWCTDYLQVMGCEKPHNFKQHTFRGPHWCDFCANFLWGLIAQGVKCQDCGFNAHKKCSEKVPNDCMPDMKYVKRMFGVDLTTLVKAQNTLIPIVVNMCIQEIEARGLDSEGLYRVAGFHDDVEAIRMSFDKDGELTDISTDRYDDINTITSVLKLYLRLLPIPLITFDLYHKVIDVIKQEDVNLDLALDDLRRTFMQLPPAHFHTLKYLIAHLYRVTEQKQVNMMSPENLATVFAPTILRSPETDPLTSLTAVKYERELVDLIIIHQNILFDAP